MMSNCKTWSHRLARWIRLAIAFAPLAFACRLTPPSTPGTGGTATGGAATGGDPATGGASATGGAGPDCRAVINRTVPREMPRTARAPVKASRIVGGNESAPGDWPASTALETVDGWPYCGATLIGSGRCALTAAHCEVAPGELVVAGQPDLRKPGGRIPIVEVRTHEGYRGDPALGHDLAILVLARVADTMPAGYLPTPARLAPYGWSGLGDAVAVGWGRTSQGGTASPVQRNVTVPLLSQLDCQQAYPSVVDGQFCAGTPGRDTCQGDSGGGLFAVIDGKEVVIGTTSWGYGCAVKPGVYQAVPAERPWIDACSEDC